MQPVCNQHATARDRVIRVACVTSKRWPPGRSRRSSILLIDNADVMGDDKAAAVMDGCWLLR